MACMIITFRSLPSMQILHAKNVMSNKCNTNSQIMESSSLSLIDSVAIHNMGDSISSIVFAYSRLLRSITSSFCIDFSPKIKWLDYTEFYRSSHLRDERSYIG